VSTEPPRGSALERLRALQQQEAQEAARAAAASAPPTRGGAAWKAVGGMGVVALLLWKFKSIFVVLLSTLGKAGKFLPTVWTMLLSVWAYALFYGWPFAAGLVILILIHELGHGAAARAMGLPVGAPVFVPFFGAMIALKERPRSTWQEAVVAAGGPVIGGVAALACVALSFWPELGPGGGLLRVVGYVGLMLNLFNLTPFWQLDGARMLTPVRPVAGLVAAVALVAVAIAVGRLWGAPVPIAFLVGGMACFQLGRRLWRARQEGLAGGRPAGALAALQRLREVDRASPDGEELVSRGHRAAALLTWFLTAAGLVAAMGYTGARLPGVG